MQNKNINLFIAEWDQQFGPNIIEKIPELMEIDLDYITMQIFFTFENFYLNSEKSQNQEPIIFTTPIKNIDKLARIMVRRIEEEEKEKSLIICLLLPDFIEKEDLTIYDTYIKELLLNYDSEGELSLKHFYQKIQEKFRSSRAAQDPTIQIDQTYTQQKALLDFKKGLQLYSKEKFEKAYFLLKKASLKFKETNQLKLLLQVTFLIGNILSQNRKYSLAREYFQDLIELAEKLKNQKYVEQGNFLHAFCSFKLHEYLESLKKFMKLEVMSLSHLDRAKYYYIYGKTLLQTEFNARATDILGKSLDLYSQKEETKSIKRRKSRLLIELGHANYKLAIDMVKKGSINRHIFGSFLEKSIVKYKESIAYLLELDDIPKIMKTYQLIANIYMNQQELEKAIENLRKALKYAKLSNNVVNRLQIFNSIVQNLAQLDKHQLLVKELDEMLSEIRTYAYIDLYTIANYHRQLGNSLMKLNQPKDALSEFLIALNVLNEFENPMKETLLILENLVEIYETLGQDKYIEYYRNEFQKERDRYKTFLAQEEKEIDIFENLKEFWVFINDGIELFSYTPESDINPELFGGFLSAIQSFSVELTSHQLKTITIGLDQYTFYREKNKPFFLMGRASRTTSNFIIEKALEKIYHTFWDKYQTHLENFSSETQQFTDFLEEFK